jgi:hypothetical protein
VVREIEPTDVNGISDLRTPVVETDAHVAALVAGAVILPRQRNESAARAAERHRKF